MTQPDALKKSEPLTWSAGIGRDVWDPNLLVLAHSERWVPSRKRYWKTQAEQQDRQDLDRLWHPRLERAADEAERAARHSRWSEPDHR